MAFSDAFDAITKDQLRATGASRWTDPEGRIGAFVAEMDFGTSPTVREALHRVIDRNCFGYSAAPIERRLQEATAQYVHRAHGWAIDPADVRPVPDVISVFEIAVKATTTAGSPVVVPTPAYMAFFAALKALGRPIIEVPMVLDEDQVFRLDVPGIVQAVRQHGAEMVVLCNPHNPTGRVLTREELEKFCAAIAPTGARVFADEIWAPLVFSGHKHVPYASISPEAASHSVTAIAASKGWNIPGLKCAQAITTADCDRDAYAAIPIPPPHRSSTIGMEGTIAAYGDASGWIQDVIGYIEGNQQIARETLGAIDGVRVPRAESTYVTWVDTSGAGLNASAAELVMQHSGVIPTGGSACGSGLTSCFRLTTAMPRPILREALAGITSTLRGV